MVYSDDSARRRAACPGRNVRHTYLDISDASLILRWMTSRAHSPVAPDAFTALYTVKFMGKSVMSDAVSKRVG